ncbi:MAG TPA: NHLP leader peptide family RiPP precursor [Candidatus Nanopelagicales bacterium]|nr:NHLP leader peptide family RiPP precursor [Candidatus Nanopelagicales bacterium]
MGTSEANASNNVARRAVSDPEFRDRLLTSPNAAVEEVTGVSVPDDVEIVVVENTAQRFHVVLPSTELDLAAIDQAVGGFAEGSREWRQAVESATSANDLASILRSFGHAP